MREVAIVLARIILISVAAAYVAHLSVEAAEGASRWQAMPAEMIATGAHR